MDIHHLSFLPLGCTIPDVCELLNPAWSFAVTVGDWWTVVAAALFAGFVIGRMRRK